MAESPSSFIDFNAWKDLTGASEREVLQRQQTDVDDKTNQAARLLDNAGDEAERAQMMESSGAGNARTTLSTTGSYGDYLKAKQSAVNARALMQLGREGAHGSTRDAVDAEGGYSTGADSALARLRGQEAAEGRNADAGIGSYTKAADVRRAAEAKKQSDMEARRSSDEQQRQGFNADLIRRMKADWGRADKASQWSLFQGRPNKLWTQGSPFGANTARGSYAPDQWQSYGETPGTGGLEDGQRLAQMARAAGLNSEADAYQSEATYTAGKRTKGGF